MDSLTQIVLGAAVGEAVCGKKAGNKAILWGAVAGTIPDLDVLSAPFLELPDELYFHRGITHSFFFAVITAPVFGWLVHKLYPKDETTYRDWTLLFLLGFVTHAILDSFTTWGTKLFYPFSDYPVAFHNIFVIDPLYTIPFLICVVAVLFYNRKDKRRRYWNYTGIGISSAYMLLTLVNKAIVHDVFEDSFKEKQINYSRYSTKPTPLNSILWSVTAEVDSGYYIGYYSLLDEDKKIDYRYYSKDHHLVEPYLPDTGLEKLLKITDGYYTVDQQGDSLIINDLRFGLLDGWGKGREDFTFVYIIERENGALKFSQKPNEMKRAKTLLGKLFERVKGRS